MKTEAEHIKMVRSLVKPGVDIAQDLMERPYKAHLMHMVMGVAGEAGELLDAIKKHCIYGKDIDLNNVIEELGDLEFYLAGIREQFNLQREDILLDNIKKLTKRYGDGWNYSNAAAISRPDKKEEKVSYDYEECVHGVVAAETCEKCAAMHSHDPKYNTGC